MKLKALIGHNAISPIPGQRDYLCDLSGYFHMKEVSLTQGYVAIIDDEDFEYINQFKWHIMKFKHTNYAGAGVFINGKQRTVRMHRLIMITPKGLDVDHINHNGLDNRRQNLRNVTRRENQWNPRNNSGHIGTFKIKNRYYARIFKEGKYKYLGGFNSYEDAKKILLQD